MNSSIRLAKSIDDDRRRGAADIRAARAAQPPTSWSSPLGRLIGFAVANLQSAGRPARAVHLRRTNASSE